MKRLLVALAFLISSCATAPIARAPETSLMATAKSHSLDLSHLFDTVESKPIPTCNAGTPCHYRLSDVIDDDSVKDASAWLAAAEEAETSFVLELNTPGGYVSSGFELSKKIEGAKVPVVCVVDGKAASMGFYILQACPVRKMTKRSSLMTHEPSITAPMSGPANDWSAVAEALRAGRDASAEHCNHRLTTTIQEYHRRTDGSLQWWFNWREAKSYHAVDEVVDSVKAVIEGLKQPLKP